MFFNSLEYLIFFLVVFTIYWIINKRVKARNLFLLTASYIFYGWWDYRFLGLIIASTVIDFYVGKLIHEKKEKKQKLLLLWVSIGFNLGLLVYFKYCNFFIDSFVDLSNSLGVKANLSSLNIILPVGISFYTFQTLSYSIDIYRGSLKPVNSFLNFATFVAFFPQLVAGPIERAIKFLPQIQKRAVFTYEKGADGLRLILFGLFKKIVIADNLARYVGPIFDNPEKFNGGELFMGATYFSFQIYCDFSGYSDIAIGSAMLLGISLTSNFKFPFFAQNLAEFWRRWHISLNTWLNDYLFLSLALMYRAKGKIAIILSLFFTFLISGFWHGAGWNFILWGGTTGLFFIVPMLRKGKRIKGLGGKTNGEIIFNYKTIPRMLLTTFLTIITFAMFRSSSVKNIEIFFERLVLNFGIPTSYRAGILLVVAILFLDMLLRKDERKVLLVSKHKVIRYILYYLLILAIAISISISKESPQFIYFQF
jgi:alginate O-acetyltransferase complex protein AlgI